MTRSLQIVPLEGVLDNELDELLARDPDTLFFPTSGYRRVLFRYLGRAPGSEIRNVGLAAVDNGGRLIAALPMLVMTHPEHGSLINSLPFYGSNGGVVPNGVPHEARQVLLTAARDLAHAEGARATTIVLSPFETDLAAYEFAYPEALRDNRIGQLSLLPERGDEWTDDESLRDSLMSACHQKTRNMVRKAWRCGIEVERSETQESLDFLARTHVENMGAIGGLAKPSAFFADVVATLPAGESWRLYIARHKGQMVAALLTLCFGSLVEYFTPVVERTARPLQPLSAIIHAAMAEAARDGRRWWNWGGTWATQDGVYRFKARWGAVDRGYQYFTILHDPSLLELPRAELGTAWPGFFAYPWAAADALKNRTSVT